MGVFTTGKQFALGLNLTSQWWLSGASIDLDLDNGRYYDSSLTTLKQPLAVVTDYLSCSRASDGYAQNLAGTWINFTSNVLRLTDRGLLVEQARTNYLLNSTAPATQTTTSLGTGSYTLWVNGSGSALASAGSATISGASSATDGNPNNFTVTGAGTVIVTVTGSLTRFQLENGAYGSSFIATTGTTATRAADVVTCTGALDTIFLGANVSTVLDIAPIAPTTESRNVFGQLGSPTNPIVFLSGADGGNRVCHFHNQDPTNLSFLAAAGNGWATDATVPKAKIGVSWTRTGGRSAVLNGETVATDALTDTPTSTTTIGSGGATPLGSYVKRLTIWNSRLADATLQGFTV